MRLHYLQHEPFEDPGTILEWAAERGHAVGGTMLFKGEPLPSPDSFDMLVVMGGSMSIHHKEKHPWLVTEEKFIREAINEDIPVLGICLGAQLIASALGAKVRKNPCKEIGWFPVSLTPQGITSKFFDGWPVGFPAFHWHGETFDIPEGAQRAAFSKACWNQAFVYGRAVALQFHVESTGKGVELLLTNCKDEIVDGQLYIQSADYIREQKQHFPQIRKLLFRLLDAMEKNRQNVTEGK
ncbi:MAG: type 1 glutamine amidotransferase [Chitinispirillaceae bacterium]|nr:type 1 glutamine amidotransferase [Chitinispirillaceae bacterium]